MLGLRKNHSVEQVIFNELVEPVHQLKLNHLKQFGARAAQIYKLLNQNSLSDTLQSLRLEMSQNTVIWSYDADFADSFSSPVPPTVSELRKQKESKNHIDPYA